MNDATYVLGPYLQRSKFWQFPRIINYFCDYLICSKEVSHCNTLAQVLWCLRCGGEAAVTTSMIHFSVDALTKQKTLSGKEKSKQPISSFGQELQEV